MTGKWHSVEEFVKVANLESLPNHINSKHVQIYRWLDGSGWSIDCGAIHIESSTIEGAIVKFLKCTEHLEEVREHRGYGLVGKLDATVDKAEDLHSYFY